MASPNDVPRVAEPIAGSGGFVTRAWLDFFLKLASTESQADLAALYAALAARVAELEENEGLSFQIIGQGAISVNGTPQPGGFVVISLENDTDAPGNTMYYGTGPTGLKGWFPISSSVAVTADLTKAVAGTGVTTFGLADLANSGVGAALQKFTRDSKGRMSGTSAATTDDLPQGATNKYFIDAPSDGQTYGRKDGTWVTITGGGAVTSVNARTGAVSVPDFVVKATTPTSSDFGRPIIEGDRWFNSTNGVEYSYVAGAWVYDNAASLSRYMPAFLANGSSSPVPLNADGTVPAYLANGTYSPFATQA